MVSVLVIADEVASNLSRRTLEDIDPDLLLSAGDLPWDYVEWVGLNVRCPTVFVPGNHDPARGPEGATSPGGVIDADGRVVQAAGLTIAGLGGCVKYREGPHQYTQREYRRKCVRLCRSARRAGPVDILLTHAPPRGLGDAEDGPHHGVEALHQVIERLEPTWQLHGHIHPYGMKMPDRRLGATTLRNVIPWTVLDVTPRSAQIKVTSRRAG